MSVSERMREDHYQIEPLLEYLKGKPTYAQFKILKLALEQHFLIEEEAVFNIVREHSFRRDPVLQQVLEDHDRILQKLRKAERDLREGRHADTRELYEKITQHMQLEDGQFYPQLDQTLDKEAREDMLAKIEHNRQQLTQYSVLLRLGGAKRGDKG